jgi:hypothetical protein
MKKAMQAMRAAAISEVSVLFMRLARRRGRSNLQIANPRKNMALNAAKFARSKLGRRRCHHGRG